MNNPLHILLVLGTAHLFTVMSPGPNQALVLAAGARSRTQGLLVAFGAWPWRLVLTGFLSNLSNPKAIAWYASIFTAAGAYDLPWQWQLVVIFGMPAIGFGWNSLLVFVVSSGPIKVLYTRAVRWIDRISGGILLVFGLKLLVAR
jgi:threonine efflux protein